MVRACNEASGARGNEKVFPRAIVVVLDGGEVKWMRCDI